ncbi:MAG: glycosyltransferase family 4 protein [Acidobacteria bacterium]|nr:glycosyltransferase family 4 protein [Acidobacteriota bacterium]
MNDYANPRAELGLDENDRLVVCAGRLEPWKGQDLLLRAAPMILREQPLTHFAILGAPVHGKEKFCLQLEKLIRDFQLEGKVHLLGERRDVIGWMRSANVVVHCSRTPDPLPGVVLEAGLAGQAIVGAFDGGVPEEVPAENYDLLFKPGVVSELASRICQALQDPDLKMKGIMAQKFVQEKFSKERLFSQLESHYEFALGGSNG